MQASADSKTLVLAHTASQSKDPERGASGAMATIQDDDERLLAEIGYEQVRIRLQYHLA